MDGFFDQMSSFKIYMDLLYKNQKYVEVLEAMDKMIEKSLGGIKFSMDCLTLATASCYKLVGCQISFIMDVLWNYLKISVEAFRRVPNCF